MDNMAVRALYFAARVGPSVFTILRIGNRVFVALEVVGLAADSIVLSF